MYLPDKVQSIKNIAVPTNKKQLQSQKRINILLQRYVET